MLRRQEIPLLCFAEHLLKKRIRDIAPCQPIPIPAEGTMIPNSIIDPETNKPPEQKIVVELLDQLPLTADRVQNLQQKSSKQLLGRGGSRHQGSWLLIYTDWEGLHG
jgi:hypothetical protein